MENISSKIYLAGRGAVLSLSIFTSRAETRAQPSSPSWGMYPPPPYRPFSHWRETKRRLFVRVPLARVLQREMRHVEPI